MPRLFAIFLCLFLVWALRPVVSTAAPTNGAVLPAIKVPAGGVDIALSNFLPVALFGGLAVRALSSEGRFDMQLLTSNAPATVTNFLKYVEAGAYRNLIVHRSVPGFVVQTGGFYWDGYSPQSVFTYAPVTNEFGLSNLRGTVAMAKVEGNPNSATSQWFVNLVDNTELDTNNGGFTVFARVLGGGMSNVDRIANLKVYNASGIRSAFNQLPLKNFNYSNYVEHSNYVTITNVFKLPGAVSSDPNAFTADNTDGKVRVKFRGFPSNNVSLQIQSLDSSTNSWLVSIPLKAPGQKFTGLLQRSNGAVPTLATLSVTAAGVFSGNLANRSGSAPLSSSSLKQQFTLTNPNTGVFLRTLGESIVFWYGHADAVFYALNFTNTNSGFTNTLAGALMPSAYSGASNDMSPLAGKIVNTVMTRTNQSPRPVSGFLQLAFDKAGAAKITGMLPDNRGASGASSIVLEPWTGEKLLPVALFVRQAQPAGLTGMLQVSAPGSGESPIAGSLNWVSGTNASSPVDVLGVVWTNNAGKNAITGDTNTVSCRLELPGVSPQLLSWGPDNRPRITSTNGVTLKFDAKTGSFSGAVPFVTSAGKQGTMPFKGICFSSTPTGMEVGLRGCGLLTATNGVVPVKLFYP